MPDLNIARSSASIAVISDHMYVFGGKNEKFGYVSAVERINLKNIASKFEVIEQSLTMPAADTGIVPLGDGEVLLIGGYNGQRLSSRFKFSV